MSLNALPAASGFRASSRYGDQPGVTVLEPEPVQAIRLEPEPDPIGEAFAQGYSKGYEEARAEADAIALEDSEAAEGLALAFARFDTALEEQLRQRLRDTVAALCEAAITPLTLDEDLLLRRVTAAAAMLARADDDRVIRVHPQDLALIAPRMRAEWDVQPDATLDRGAIRVEGAHGGVEDGPATWRRAIAEALHQC
ncbi:FliH/SctL family protein [Novosphingobium sp. 9U]|uniref:FliH/SctL family protein n=1 Tax=Novosphingobium sp. 9U TaxID=2653158 RepID=UPI0012F2ECED|nr:FliH/SctL family protein [Novosphingobium sp. 9U]VWX53061.1 Flagellar biosynthesis protein [Novosphingobium sp. 9U]